MNRNRKIALLALETAALAALVPSPAMATGFSMYGVCVALAALLAVLALHGAGRQKRSAGNAVEALDLAAVCIPAAVVGARLCYCLSRFGYYFLEMHPLSVLRVWEGGYMLYGAVLFALAAAALLAKRRGRSAAATLDALAVPGLLAAAVCRLGEGLVGEGIGTWVEQEALMRFPFAVQNEFGEWQLAVFMLEAVTALLLAGAVSRVEAGRGRRMETALLLYACCQVLLESLRMDSCLKVGFVRINQVISALVILGVTALRAHRAGGRKAVLCRAAVVLACAALVGGIEWALDKTLVNNLLLYMGMIALCGVMAANALCPGGGKKGKAV